MQCSVALLVDWNQSVIKKFWQKHSCKLICSTHRWAAINSPLKWSRRRWRETWNYATMLLSSSVIYRPNVGCCCCCCCIALQPSTCMTVSTSPGNKITYTLINIENSSPAWLYTGCKKGKGSPHSITERRVPELIPVLGSQPARNVSHKPGGRQPLLSARPAVTPATLKRAATNFAAWWTEAQWVWTVCYPTASRLRFEPGPFCAWVQHANHSATEPLKYTGWQWRNFDAS